MAINKKMGERIFDSFSNCRDEELKAHRVGGIKQGKPRGQN